MWFWLWERLQNGRNVGQVPVVPTWTQSFSGPWCFPQASFSSSSSGTPCFKSSCLCLSISVSICFSWAHSWSSSTSPSSGRRHCHSVASLRHLNWSLARPCSLCRHRLICFLLWLISGSFACSFPGSVSSSLKSSASVRFWWLPSKCPWSLYPILVLSGLWRLQRKFKFSANSSAELSFWLCHHCCCTSRLKVSFLLRQLIFCPSGINSLIRLSNLLVCTFPWLNRIVSGGP